MPREQTEELLARVAGRAGDGDARSVDGRCARRTRGAGSDLIPGCSTSLAECMHQKVYLYTDTRMESIDFDV